MPNKNLSPNFSVSVFQPAAIVVALRACIDAMPVAIVKCLVAESNIAHEANGSRPTASGTQTHRKPSSSSSTTASCARDIGCRSKSNVQIPTRPKPKSERFLFCILIYHNANQSHTLFRASTQNLSIAYSLCAYRTNFALSCTQFLH